VEKEKETKNEKVDVLRSIAEQFGKVKKKVWVTVLVAVNRYIALCRPYQVSSSYHPLPGNDFINQFIRHQMGQRPLTGRNIQ